MAVPRELGVLPSVDPTASGEVDETLRLNADEAERDIADYRVWGFAVSSLFLLALALHTGALRIAFAMSVVCFACALAMRWAVRRWGARPGSWFSAFDLFAISAVFATMPRFMPREEQDLWTSAVMPACLQLAVMMRVLRMTRRVAFTGIASAALYLLVVTSQLGLRVQFIFIAVVLSLSGVVGVAAATRARRNLNIFAKLWLLRRYLPEAAVERVLREDPEISMSLGGRVVTVTLLASDLRGFTAMSERLPPEEVVAQLNAYHSVMLEQVESEGGVVDKFVGDGTLAIFGLKDPGADAGATAAIGCARRMLAALQALNQQRARAGAESLQMGVGIHTGSVVAGNIGSPSRRLEFTVIGDAVNTATRLEGLTKEAGTPVLVSSETVRRASREGLRELPPMVLRGKNEPIIAFALD